MKREWKPGDVVFVANDVGGFVGMADHKGLVNGFDRNGSEYTGRTVPAGRQLVVIDPEEREQVDALCKSLVESMHRAGDRASAANGVHPATVSDALRSLIAPPRPDEPTGLGAVVEDTEGHRWTRNAEGEWCAKSVHHANYSSIAAVKVLSDGVQS